MISSLRGFKDFRTWVCFSGKERTGKYSGSFFFQRFGKLYLCFHCWGPVSAHFNSSQARSVDSAMRLGQHESGDLLLLKIMSPQCLMISDAHNLTATFLLVMLDKDDVVLHEQTCSSVCLFLRILAFFNFG